MPPPQQHPQINADRNFADAEEAAFVDELVLDPREIPDTFVLVGHLGKSARTTAAETWWRLYLRLDFKAYIEFREADMRRCQDAMPGQPLAGTLVWLASDVRIWHVDVQTRHLDVAEYVQQASAPRPSSGTNMLQGPITSQGIESATPAHQMGAGWAPLATLLGCPPSWWRC